MSATVDASGLVNLLHERAVEWVDLMTEDFVDRAQQRCSRRTGELAESITATDAADGWSSVTATVEASAEHALYQEEGTGIYGPDGVRIEPTHSKVLVFDWPAAGGIVFATSVEGAPGTHFWSLTLDEWPEIVRSI